jgi:uncharacterized protein YndB with AHSA1/START domain
MSLIKGSLFSLGDTGLLRIEMNFDVAVEEVWSALTDPERLSRWYGKFEGDFRVDGEFTGFVFVSEWEGRGTVDACEPLRKLHVTMWEEGQSKQKAKAELFGSNPTTLIFEEDGLPLEYVWAFGAGWHMHFEDLALHLAGNDRTDFSSTARARFDEHEAYYKQAPVIAV